MAGRDAVRGAGLVLVVVTVVTVPEGHVPKVSFHVVLHASMTAVFPLVVALSIAALRGRAPVLTTLKYRVLVPKSVKPNANGPVP